MLRIAIPEFELQPNYPKALKALGAEAIKYSLDMDVNDFDGLLMPGGRDINPKRYNQPLAGSVNIDDEYDELQFTALDRFVKAGKPVFGICRGEQILNIYFGGDLIQDIENKAVHTRNPGENEKTHEVEFAEGSILYRLYGSRGITNSTHHQLINNVAEDLIVTARTADGYVEGIEHKTLPVFGVQWHPERMCFEYAKEGTTDGSLLFKEFFKRCDC